MKEISSHAHPLVKYFVRLNQDSKFRRHEKRVLVHGIKSVRDVAKKFPIKRLLVHQCIPSLRAVETIIVPESILNKISGVQASEGVIAEFELPVEHSLEGFHHIIVCDQIQDPGNMGTLIRSALAMNWQGLFCLPGCVDPFNDKALRAAKGATFFLPLRTGSWDDLEKLGCPLFVADLDGDPIASLKLPQKIALVLGNEGQGVSVPGNFLHHKISIPISSQMESLNVAAAAAILMYVLQPQGA